MTSKKEIEWKVSGLLPMPIGDKNKYYLIRRDGNYYKRTFGLRAFDASSYTLEPTKLFHQALDAELRKKYGKGDAVNRLPYSIRLGELGSLAVGLRLRVLGDRFLIVSIQLSKLESNQSVSEIIEFQKLSSHPVLESIARFCFNVHFCPDPSQTVVKSWNSKPLLRITPKGSEMSAPTLVEIVTRHKGIGERAISEMIKKNEELNFNKDLLLIDKQGMVFLQKTQDENNQRNRYRRISSLFEYALYVNAFNDSIGFLSGLYGNQAALSSEIALINRVLRSDVLSESVSASRGWDLLKKEMNLHEIRLEPSGGKGQPFYKAKWFLATSALVGLISSFLAIADYFKGGD